MRSEPHWADVARNKGVQRMIDVLIELLRENQALKESLAEQQKKRGSK
jgi:hypothetical protein